MTSPPSPTPEGSLPSAQLGWEALQAYNRRSAYRVRPPAAKKVPAVAVVGAMELDAWLVDISVEGLRIAIKSPLARHVPTEQPVRIRLRFPDAPAELEIPGELIMVLRLGKLTHFGVCFDTLAPGWNRTIERAIVDYVMQRQRDQLGRRSDLRE